MRNDIIRAHLFVSGRVQGVFFRHNTYKNAVSLNLKGFVRNLNDGGVEVVAEGKKEDVNKLIEFCRKGPLFAKVDDVDIRYGDATDEFKGFTVEH